LHKKWQEYEFMWALTALGAETMVIKKASYRPKDDSVVVKKKAKQTPQKAGEEAKIAKTSTISNEEAEYLVTSSDIEKSDSKGKNTMSTELKNGIKAVGEAFVAPGSSLIIDGDVKNGALHLVGGLAAKSLVGPIGWGLIAADSFSLSVSGKHLHQHFYTSKKA
jgi:hypothetical protein